MSENYIALYRAAASLIPQGSKVVELGCGSGTFASLAHHKFKTYIGYDKDKEAIEQARRFAHNFTVADITKVPFNELGCTFVALEVFEHLLVTQDLTLLDGLPKGSRVIISVPSFDSADHEIFFPSEWEAINHFGSVLDMDLWRKIRIPTGAGYFHLMRGYR